MSREILSPGNALSNDNLNALGAGSLECTQAMSTGKEMMNCRMPFRYVRLTVLELTDKEGEKRARKKHDQLQYISSVLQRLFCMYAKKLYAFQTRIRCRWDVDSKVEQF